MMRKKRRMGPREASEKSSCVGQSRFANSAFNAGYSELVTSPSPVGWQSVVTIVPVESKCANACAGRLMIGGCSIYVRMSFGLVSTYLCRTQYVPCTHIHRVTLRSCWPIAASISVWSSVKE